MQLNRASQRPQQLGGDRGDVSAKITLALRWGRKWPDHQIKGHLHQNSLDHNWGWYGERYRVERHHDVNLTWQDDPLDTGLRRGKMQATAPSYALNDHRTQLVGTAHPLCAWTCPHAPKIKFSTLFSTEHSIKMRHNCLFKFLCTLN